MLKQKMTPQARTVATVGVILVSFMMWLWFQSPGTPPVSEVEAWLDDNKFTSLKYHPKIKGISTLKEFSNLDIKNIEGKEYLDDDIVSKLVAAVDMLNLELWLRENDVMEALPILLNQGYYSLGDLCKLTVDNNLQRIENQISTVNSREKFAAISRKFLDKMCDEQLYIDQSAQQRGTGWTWTGILWFCLVVIVVILFTLALLGCLLYVVFVTILQQVAEAIGAALGAIIVAIVGGIFAAIGSAITGRRIGPVGMRLNTTTNRRQAPATPSSTSRFSLGLYDRIRGAYFDHSQCKIEWNCNDTVKVGGSTVITLQLMTKSGKPYEFQTSDNFQCTVTHKSTDASTPHVVEPSPLIGHNTIKVSFMARTAGAYVIDVKINGKRIGCDSPLTRTFLPGPVDASKTVFVDQTAVLVVTKGVYSTIKVIPQDSFENIAVISQENLTVVIRKNSADGPVVNPECVVNQEQCNQYELLLKVEEVGHFICCVKYNGSTIGPSNFMIISLTDEHSKIVETNVNKKSLNVWYDAQMSTPGKKDKTVYCYISPRQLQVREYFMKIIPTRVFSCKVCPSTRIFFHAEPGRFTIDDCYQEPVTLYSPHRDLLGATFYKFVLKNIGGSEKFQDKRTFFYDELKKHHNKHGRGELRMVVSRYNLLESARKATKGFGTADWCRKFVIEFRGEEGLDWGGVSREFFEILSVECFDISNRMFTSFNKDNMQSLVHPNRDRPDHLRLKHFEFAGKIVGKCMYESAHSNPLMVKARFTRSFLAQIIRLRINYQYFATDDPELYTTKILYIKDNDVTDLGLVFAEEEFHRHGSNPKVIVLKENGSEIDVTEENKMEYLDLLAQYRLAKNVKEEIEHFLKGLNEIIPENLLSIFDENDLELLMCGMGRVSFDDLKQHAVVSGSSPRFHVIVTWFWTIVSDFTQEEMAKLLQFVTGCSQLPPGGFTELSPKFQITYSPTRGRLPTAHTCFNQLCLPTYDSCEEFQTSLMLALNEGVEGFGLL